MKSLLMALFVVAIGTFTYGRDVSPEFERAHIRGAKTRIVLKAVDDVGNPVAGASIHVLMGMNYRLKSYDIDGVTDTNGIFVVEGKTTGNEIEITARKDGHYEVFKKLCFISIGNEYEVKNGKWQPWGMEMLLSLRRRLNPVDLIVSGDSFYVPSTNSWIGFDMAKKDWVYEGKTGVKSNFEVFVTWDGKVTAYSDMLKVDVRFTGRDEGYYLADPILDCSFSGIYSANTNNVFRQEFSCRVVRDGRRMLSGIEPGKLIVMRSRCEHDNGHRLVGANYSVLNGFLLHGGFNGKVEMTMCYFFNPTPNDTNLEPKR